jgi:long-chain fatty acid transport protein
VRTPAVAVAAALLVAPAVRANPIDAFGFGARSPAMAGAGTAAARDGAANYYNPAALAVGDDVRIDLGYQLAVPRLSLNGGAQDVDDTRGFAVGIAVPGNVAGLPVAFGVALLLPDERLVRTRTLPQDRPRWMYYDNRPQRLFLSTNVALRLGDDLHVGGGVSIMSRTQGAVDLSGRVGFPVAEDSELFLDIDVKLRAVRYPQAGILWRARPWLELGLTYRGGFVLEIDQRFAVRGDLGPEGSPIIEDAFFSLRAMALDLFQPTQVALGVSARLGPRLTVTGDLTYQRWSAYENPAAKIEIEYDLQELDDFVVIPAQLPLEEADFHDILVPRLGVEVLAAGGRRASLFARAGYAYEPSPAPEQRGATNFVDNDKHTVSLGAGLEVHGLGAVLPRPFDVDLFVALGLLPERLHHKRSVLDPVGDYASRGTVLSAGLASRWRF